MATIVDVAKLAGVSKTTVSRVLNATGPVNEKTRRKIESAMEQLDFTPNYFAQGMKTSKTRSLGIIVPDFSNPFYPEMFKGIEAVTRKRGYMNFVCVMDEEAATELAHIQELLRRKVDGIIMNTYKRVQKDIDFLVNISQTVPVVFMDPVVHDEPLSFVVSDGQAGTMEAARYLLKLGKRRIGYIKGSKRHWVTRERFSGYKMALKEAGAEFDRDLVYEGDFHLESGLEGAKALMEKKRPPDAIMTATDLMAVGALKYLNYAGVLVPEEVNVVGFDNIPLADLVEPGLTTVAQPIRTLGERAANILIEQIEEPQHDVQKVVLKCSLIVRGTTDPIDNRE
ncbi:MAG: LacI family transcriptional regulator [bacterium]|nr:LacI family transcriptional regulator [bacterium]